MVTLRHRCAGGFGAPSVPYTIWEPGVTPSSIDSIDASISMHADAQRAAHASVARRSARSAPPAPQQQDDDCESS